MNTIKFSKKQNISTEQHDLEMVELKDVTLFGTDIILYKPCNVNIFVTEICNNNCSFCINKMTNKCMKMQSMTDNEYFYGVETLLKNLNNNDFEITITGGEPTLNMKKFVETIHLCNYYHFKCRTVSTTGKNLLNIFNGKHICQYMIEENFIHNINISRMHYNENKNAEVFQGINITNDEIEKLSTFFKLNDAEMRISCNLLNKYIDNFPKMLEFVDFYKNIGVDTIMFRELVGCNNIKLNSLIFNNLQEFKYLKTLHGLVYDVDVYEYKDMIVKHYKTLNLINKDIIYSLSYKNGFIIDVFNGNKLTIDLIKEIN